MEKAKKNIPTLRFPQFEGKWETKKIGQILQIGSGRDFKHLKKGNIPVFGTGGLMDKVDTALYTGETVFIGRKGTIDRPVYFNGSFWTVDTLFYTYDFNLSYPKFVYALFQRINWYAHNEASGVPSLSKTTINSLKINLPSLQEQQKIADFLTTTDKRIELLTKKKELCQQYKKAMMQKLFSQELRFKDENGKEFPKWEMKKAKDIFESYSNKNHNGDLPILAATQDKGMVYRNDIDINIISSEASVKSYKIVEKGNFVISLRSFQGGIEYSYLQGICSPAYTILKSKCEIVDDFYRYYFKKEEFINRLSQTVIGIREGKQISYSAFGGLKIPYPSVSEQKKIADFLTILNKKIELVEKEIHLSEQFKKYLLQNLFV